MAEFKSDKYYEGSPSDIRKVITRMKKEGATQNSESRPMREGRLYQLEVVGKGKGYDIWTPGQLKEKSTRRTGAWDLKDLNALRTSRPAVFRSLYYTAVNSIAEWHICNAVHTVRYTEADNAAYEVWKCLHTSNDDAKIDAVNNLRYAIAIMAVCIAGVTDDEKRTYKSVRKVIKYNKETFLVPLLEDRAYEYVQEILKD